MKTNIKLLLSCLVLLINSVVYAQNNTNSGNPNIDLSILSGIGKHSGETQMTFGINAAILKSASEAFSFGIGGRLLV